MSWCFYNLFKKFSVFFCPKFILLNALYLSLIEGKAVGSLFLTPPWLLSVICIMIPRVDSIPGGSPAAQERSLPEEQRDPGPQRAEPAPTESLQQDLLGGGRSDMVDTRSFVSCDSSEARTPAEDGHESAATGGPSQAAQPECADLSSASDPDLRGDSAGQPTGVGLPELHPGHGGEHNMPQGSPASAPSPSGPRLSASRPALEEPWLGAQSDREELRTCLIKEQLSRSSFGGLLGISYIEPVPAEHPSLSAPVSLCDLGGQDLHAGRSGSSAACYALATDVPGTLDAVGAREASGNSFSWNLKELVFSEWADRTSSNCSCASSERVGTASPSLAGSDVDVSAVHGPRAEAVDDRELLLLAGTCCALGEGQRFHEGPLDRDRPELSDTCLESLECDGTSGRESPGCILAMLGAGPADRCLREEPRLSIQVTSTPVRGDSSATPRAASPQHEIQEGTYAGSCCHRDGSLLSASRGRRGPERHAVAGGASPSRVSKMRMTSARGQEGWAPGAAGPVLGVTLRGGVRSQGRRSWWFFMSLWGSGCPDL